MHERANSDPRYIAWETEFGVCLSRKGFSHLNSFERASDYIIRRAEAFVGLDSLSDEQRSELSFLQNEEVQLAKAFIECGAMPFEVAPVYAELLDEYEQAFVEDNQALILKLAEELRNEMG